MDIIDIFKQPSQFKRTNIVPTNSMYVSRMMEQIYKSYHNYYREKYRYVENDHRLARFLTFMQPPDGLDDNDIGWYVRNKTPSVSSMFGFSSYLRKGFPLKDSMFYGNKTTEIYIIDESSYEKNISEDEIYNLTPITVLRHDMNGLDFPYLDGTMNSTDGDISVMKINIEMLLFQYMSWRKFKFREGIYDPQAGHFVSRIVIPSLIRSHMNVVCLNRIMNAIIGTPNENKQRIRHPFYIIDITGQLNAFCDYIVNRLLKEPLRFEDIVANIRGFNGGLIFNELTLPNTYINVQNRWGLFIAYLPILNFMLDLDGLSDSDLNTGLKSRWIYRMKTLRSESDIAKELSNASREASLLTRAQMDEFTVKLSV